MNRNNRSNAHSPYLLLAIGTGIAAASVYSFHRARRTPAAAGGVAVGSLRRRGDGRYGGGVDGRARGRHQRLR